MRKNQFLLYAFALLLLTLISSLSLPLLSMAQITTETSAEYSFKISIEQHLEQRLNRVLKEVTNIDELVAVVNAEIVTKPSRNKSANKRKKKILLPGVPARETMRLNSQSTSSSLSQLPVVVKRLHVKVLVAKGVSDDLTDIIHDVAISIIGYNPDRGDQLEIQELEFIQKRFKWSKLLYPPDIYILIMIIFGVIFMGAAATFFANPFKSLTPVLKTVTIDRNSSEENNRQRDSRQNNWQPEPLPQTASPETSLKKSGIATPFDFIGPDNIDELAFLLKESSAQNISTVANYISPELAQRLLRNFSVETQSEVAVLLSTANSVEPETVKNLEATIKDKLSFVVGGQQKLASILDQVDDEVRDRVFETLEQKDYETARRIRKKILTFESVIRSLTPQSIQALTRQVEPSTMATVLDSTAGDVQKKILQSLGEGISQRLEEEMKYLKKPSKLKLKKERTKIVSIYRQMHGAGMIDLEDDSSEDIG